MNRSALPFDAALRDAVERFVREPTVLIASDFDGTLAELVDLPSAARANPASIEALRRLSRLRHVHTAVVSGRSLSELVALTKLSGATALIGSHGAESEGTPLDHGLLPHVRQVQEALIAIGVAVPEVRIELKTTGAALHTRCVDPRSASRAERLLAGRFGHDTEVFMRTGKDVVEVSVVATTKGDAVERLRREAAATATCFIGDDVTDEDAFAAMGPNDLSVKVGDGVTLAQWRVGSVTAVADLLAFIADERELTSP